jgi:hypothetical protein
MRRKEKRSAHNAVAEKHVNQSNRMESRRMIDPVPTREDFEELRTFGMWGHRPARQASLR